MPPNTTRIINIASGANHSLLLLETCDSSLNCETALWGSGDGSTGQLGTAYQQLIKAGASAIFRPIELPLQQEGLSGYKIKFVTASWETTYIVFSHEGKGDVLISMGANDFGDLGIGGKGKGKETLGSFHIISFAHLTVNRMSLRNATLAFQSVEAGQHHVVAQLNATWKNRVTKPCTIGWGTSRHGQLGNVLGKGGKPVPYLSIPTLVPAGDPGDPILSVALGNQHTVLLHASGKISGLGSNRKGQLQGLENARCVSQLGCTWNGTYVVSNDKEGVSCIYATGSGAHGQLGRHYTPTLPTSDGLPSLSPVDLAIPSNSPKILALACGTEHVLALLSQGAAPERTSEVWCWGWNEHGNLGTGTTKDVFTPIKIWPPAMMEGEEETRRAIGIWAGSGTSWLFTRQ
ncbi:hypothetical protein D9615_001089 [Tricholomella constricta]|uniref:RCC1/BLIP-II protein n=1 Tax=Tricholomella constricta TaxID=117010 RepID=A0A8H5HL82_9AGAR|nr:hypothetical protein D9615_001089 [Tricholomella constricta]